MIFTAPFVVWLTIPAEQGPHHLAGVQPHRPVLAVAQLHPRIDAEYVIHGSPNVVGRER